MHCVYYINSVEEKKLLNKVIIFVLVHKKYSCHFITLRLNHCSHVDYFNDVFTTFLVLESGNNVAVYREVRKLSDLIKNICVPKMNEGLTGLE